MKPQASKIPAQLLDDPDGTLRQIETGYFQAAALCGWASTSLQFFALILGTLTALELLDPAATSVIVGLAAFGSAAFQISGHSWKSAGERVLRRREMKDGLGEAISRRRLADFLADAPKLVVWLGKSAKIDEPYYASVFDPSLQRVLANTYESAWWTTRLSRSMISIEMTRLAVTLGVSFLLLKDAGSGNLTSATVGSLSTLAEGLMLLILTHGPFGRLLGFIELNKISDQTVRAAEQMIKGRESPTAVHVLALLSEYQLARQSAPRVSMTVWKLRRRQLNMLWNDITQQ